ncbi:MAG: hypothetical protein WCD70_12595 [Alphaproteobacteria bacterium]
MSPSDQQSAQFSISAGGVPNNSLHREMTLSCPSGQTFTELKNGAPICGNASVHHSPILEAIIFVPIFAVLWVTIFIILDMLDRPRQKRVGGLSLAGQAGAMQLVTGITFLIMFGLYYVLNTFFGLTVP